MRCAYCALRLLRLLVVPANAATHSAVILRRSPRSGEPRRIGCECRCPRPSFETPRKSAAPQDDGGVCVRALAKKSFRFEFQTATRPRSRAAARGGLLVCLPFCEGKRSAERRIVNKPRLVSRIAGKQHHTATPPGAPPRRLKTPVRSSGDVATLGDFAPHACPRPASSQWQTPYVRAGRKPGASRDRACEARPQAPHPAGLGYPAPAKLKALSHFRLASRSAPSLDRIRNIYSNLGIHQ